MNEEMCDHVGSGVEDTLVIRFAGDEGRQYAFCRLCVCNYLRERGLDPTQYAVGYSLYRSTDPNLPKDQWERVNIKPLPFDREPEQGEGQSAGGVTYHYYTRNVNAFGFEDSDERPLKMLPKEWPDIISDE